jgi:hypothetical protein
MELVTFMGKVWQHSTFQATPAQQETFCDVKFATVHLHQLPWLPNDSLFAIFSCDALEKECYLLFIPQHPQCHQTGQHQTNMRWRKKSFL